MTTENEIVYCDGIYEVHPSVGGGRWIVINSATGNEHSRYADKGEAISVATALNETLGN